jgi:hypothetical protein
MGVRPSCGTSSSKEDGTETHVEVSYDTYALRQLAYQATVSTTVAAQLGQ